MSAQSLQATLDLLQGQLKDLTTAIRAAYVQSKSTNAQIAADGKLALAQFQAQYKALLVRIDQLRQAASEEEMPSAFMLALSRFSDGALATARDVGVVVQKLPDVAKKIAAVLPWVLGIAAVLVVLYLMRSARGT